MLNDPALPCFTISEAAHYLRISRALLYTLIRGGRIKRSRSARARSCAAPSSSGFSTSSKPRRGCVMVTTMSLRDGDSTAVTAPGVRCATACRKNLEGRHP
jgi:excisionase family DNA binding protein